MTCCPLADACLLTLARANYTNVSDVGRIRPTISDFMLRVG